MELKLLFLSMFAIVGAFLIGYKIGIARFSKFGFSVIGEPSVTFESGDTVEETNKKIEHLVRQNIKYEILKGRLLELPKEIREKYEI